MRKLKILEFLSDWYKNFCVLAVTTNRFALILKFANSSFFLNKVQCQKQFSERCRKRNRCYLPVYVAAYRVGVEKTLLFAVHKRRTSLFVLCFVLLMRTLTISVGGNFLYMVLCGCACRMTPFFSAPRYMIGPLFSPNSIWLTHFFLLVYERLHFFWHPGICTYFSLRDFWCAACSLGIHELTAIFV